MWDFRLPRVASINTSGHKYGLVYPGIGWVVWRDSAALPEELIFRVNYLGGEMPTLALNFSRPGDVGAGARSGSGSAAAACRLRRPRFFFSTGGAVGSGSFADARNSASAHRACGSISTNNAFANNVNGIARIAPSGPNNHAQKPAPQT
jgi:hypothetical protein